jgi:hypothetical protein
MLQGLGYSAHCWESEFERIAHLEVSYLLAEQIKYYLVIFTWKSRLRRRFFSEAEGVDTSCESGRI